MNSATYLGIPREQIQWYPIIELSKCPGCKLCIEVCEGAGHDVYEFDNSSKKPIVAKPTHCLVGCKACGKVCPTKVITFPSRDKLKQMLRDLRKKYKLK